MARKLTLEDFIKKSKEIHGDKYDYSQTEYVNNHTPLNIVCPEHGPFIVRAKTHFGKYKQGCPVCGIGILNLHAKTARSRKTHEQFLKDAKMVHGDRYDYSQCNYTGGKVKMPIICHVHGIFYQHAEGHINSKQGCLKCYHDSRKGKGGGGYALEYFEIHPDKRTAPGTLYVARMQHKNDDFIKVGITATGGVKERFYHKAMHGTIITPLYEISLNLFEAFQREQELLNLLAPYRYFPNRKFAGYTECFKNNDEVLSVVKQFLG